MRNRFSILFLIIIFSTTFLFAQTNKPDSAKSILSHSVELAKKSNKSVFVIFHASWCIWCKRLDAALESSELKKIFNDHFVIVHIDVLERKEKKDELENPGGEKIMADLGGKDAGLPFYVFLNSDGKEIVNSKSMPKKQNIGYPAAKEEITTFVNLLKKSSSSLTKHQLAKVKDYLQKNAPKG
jgi:thioredoxin-related protein